MLNHPSLVLCIGRTENARRLSRLPFVVTPYIRTLSRHALLEGEEISYPVLLRTQGSHTGKHFVRVGHREALAVALAELPGDEVMVIEPLDATGPDGMVRKYRVMLIDAVLYPLHLAISADWKVHYFSAAMATQAAFRNEERRFPEAMAGVLGPPRTMALRTIARTLDLDYAGVDLALRTNGSLLLFEANATILMHPPDAAPMWDYRRHPIARAIRAARHMVLARGRPTAAAEKQSQGLRP